MRLDLPAAARAAAPRRVGDDARPRIAVLPAGSSEPSLYPSVASWLLVLDALTDAVPDLQPVMLGRLTRDEPSSTGPSTACTPPAPDGGHHGRVAESRLVRDATVEDAAACAALYAPYVRDTVVSFELAPPTAGEMAARIEAALARHAWVVLEDGGRVAGYAYGAPFDPRAAYDWSTSVSVYTGAGRRRTGAGRALCTTLLDRLAGRGHLTALAGVALPNEASVGLHAGMGFEPVGSFRRVGWKLGRWHDVTWFQRPLGDGAGDDGAPPAPRR